MLVICAVTFFAAQQSEEMLTNVRTLIESGMPVAVILAKLTSARANFGASADQGVKQPLKDDHAQAIPARLATGVTRDELDSQEHCFPCGTRVILVRCSHLATRRLSVACAPTAHATRQDAGPPAT